MGRYDSLSSRLDDIKWEIDSASDDASELEKEIEDLEDEIKKLKYKKVSTNNLNDQLKMELLNEAFQMYSLDELETIFKVECGKPLTKIKL